jgi:hypothetical protein
MKHRFYLGFDANGVLARSGRASRPDRFARDPGGKLPGLDWLGHNASGTDDRLVADVCHDDASCADPAISTDVDLTRLSWLIANRNVQSVKRMGFGA